MKKIMFAAVIALSCFLYGCGAPAEKIQKEEKTADILVGVEAQNPPYYMVGEDGDASGYYVELMKALAEKGAFTYDFVPLNGLEFLGGASGICDVFLGTLTLKEEDREQYVQTTPVLESAPCLVVRKQDGYVKMKDLRQTSISAKAGGSEEQMAGYLEAKYGADRLLFADSESSWDDFERGYSGAVISDEYTALFKKKADSNLVILKKGGGWSCAHRFTALSSGGLPDSLTGSLEALMQGDGWSELKQRAGLLSSE